jgi:hypothetical protein
MRVLLDENVPQPLHAILSHLLQGHVVDHVGLSRWRSKQDVPLLRDAGRRYHVFVTNDMSQYNDPAECRAIKDSGLHHVTYTIDDGLDGLARACGALCAAMRGVVAALEGAPAQRIVRVEGLGGRKRRFRVSDPERDPPSAYWR